MKKQVLAFGASNSIKSINKTLATYAANQLTNTSINLVDLNNFEMPIYSIDHENNIGIPQLAFEFKELIKNANGIIISFAEHNGAYSTAFKNIFDWISRIEKDIWYGNPMFLMATAPGPRGGKSVLKMAVDRIGKSNPNVVAQFSLPSFGTNFSNKGITDPGLANEFKQQLQLFIEALS